MMGWIIGEILILRQPTVSWIEVFYFVGLAMAVLALVAARASPRRRFSPRGRRLVSSTGQRCQ